MAELKNEETLALIEEKLAAFARTAGADFDRNFLFALLAADAVRIEKSLSSAVSKGTGPAWAKAIAGSGVAAESFKSGLGFYRSLKNECEAGKETVLITSGGFLFKVLGARIARDHLSVLSVGGLFSLFTPSATLRSVLERRKRTEAARRP